MVRSGAISRVTVLTTHIRGLMTPLITTHEPPSRSCTLYNPQTNPGIDTGGSWDLASKVISALIGVTHVSKYGYVAYNPSYYVP